MFKRGDKYFSKHPTMNAFTHAFGGLGIGILITHPFIGEHPVRWGVSFLILSTLGHLYAYNSKGK